MIRIVEILGFIGATVFAFFVYFVIFITMFGRPQEWAPDAARE